MPRWRGTTVAGVELDIVGDGAFEGPAELRDIADGERGTVAAVDELARAHAPSVADGEHGSVAAVVLVVKLGRDYN